MSLQNLPPVSNLEDRRTAVAVPEDWLERPLAEYMREDSWPIPATVNREGYGEDRHLEYWLSGLRDYLALKRLLDRHGMPLDGAGDVLEIGCSTGRVLRHLSTHERALQVWGCDIKRRYVEWICSHLSPDIRVLESAPEPRLPLPDGRFGLVCAFSVFTHIHEWELAWLCELARLLRPGGMAYLTILSDRTWGTLQPGAALYAMLAATRLASGPRVTPELFRGPMPEPRVAFTWDSVEAGNSLVFHSLDHVQRVWGRFLRIVDVVPQGHWDQDVVLLQKP